MNTLNYILAATILFSNFIVWRIQEQRIKSLKEHLELRNIEDLKKWLKLKMDNEVGGAVRFEKYFRETAPKYIDAIKSLQPKMEKADEKSRNAALGAILSAFFKELLEKLPVYGN